MKALISQIIGDWIIFIKVKHLSQFPRMAVLLGRTSLNNLIQAETAKKNISIVADVTRNHSASKWKVSGGLYVGACCWLSMRIP